MVHYLYCDRAARGVARVRKSSEVDTATTTLLSLVGRVQLFFHGHNWSSLLGESITVQLYKLRI